MELKFKKGTLKQAEPKDADTLAKWWADGKVMEHAGFPNGIQTDMNKLKDRLKKQGLKDILWLIIDEDHQSIGEMHHEVKANTAVIGIKICEISAQGKGLGPVALKRLIVFLFETMPIGKIWLDTMIENTRAQKVYKKLYFEQTKINKDIWQDQLGNMRTAVEFELHKNTYKKHTAFFKESVN